jgi:hypothetical protein
MHVCAWSATPQLDKESVFCGMAVIGSICLWTKAILSLKEEPGKSFFLDGNLKNAFEQLGDLDITQPKLVWALGGGSGSEVRHACQHDQGTRDAPP